jgi:hypothetical protein
MSELFGSAPHHSRYFPRKFDFHKLRTVIWTTGAAETNIVPALRDRFVTSTHLSGYADGSRAVLAPPYLSSAFAPKSRMDRFVC